MTREDILKLKVTVHKELTFDYEVHLLNDPDVEVDDYLDTIVEDLEYEYNKPLEEISKEETIEYIRNCFDSMQMEQLLEELYPEIDIE